MRLRNIKGAEEFIASSEFVINLYFLNLIILKIFSLLKFFR